MSISMMATTPYLLSKPTKKSHLYGGAPGCDLDRPGHLVHGGEGGGRGGSPVGGVRSGTQQLLQVVGLVEQPVGGHHQPPLKQAVQGQEKTSLFGEKEKGSTLVIVNFVVKDLQPGW